MKEILDVVNDSLFNKKENLKNLLETRDKLCNNLASIQLEINLNRGSIGRLEEEAKQLSSNYCRSTIESDDISRAVNDSCNLVNSKKMQENPRTHE